MNNGIHMPMQLLVQHLRHKNEEKQFKQSKLSLLIISIFDPLRKHAHAIYRRFFTAVKVTIFSRFFYYFHIFSLNIDCVYTLVTKIYVLEQK